MLNAEKDKMTDKKAKGKVYLIGAGPGDPSLFTLKGKAILQKADVIVYDYLASDSLLHYAQPMAERIYVGKISGNHAMPQEEITALLVKKGQEGLCVARLKGGDPYIFGRGGEEGEALFEAGVSFEVVPGISSAIAAPAYAGIPLTHRDHASSVTIITGHERADSTHSKHNWQALAQSASTLVFVMGMKNLPNIAKNLIEAGLDPKTPAAIVQWGTSSKQRSLAAPLCELPAKAHEEGFSSPAAIVVGHVVCLREKLSWFEKKALHGKNIVVTRAREQASDLALQLSERGANVVLFPTIEILPQEDFSQLDAKIAQIASYDWLIFTSVNGVSAFFDRLFALQKDSRSLHGLKIAAIGSATAKALQKYGLIADFVPEKFVAESLAEGLCDPAMGGMKGKKIALARAEEARDVLPNTLQEAGAQVDIIPVYKTVLARAKQDEVLGHLKEGNLHAITFGSSSTVKHFFAQISPESLRKYPLPAFVCIGPITAKTLEEYGFSADVMPEEFTIPSMLAAIEDFFTV